MKMKTIIRQAIGGELLINTLPHDSDSGIVHQVFYPELRLGEKMIVGFGFTDVPQELKGRPVIVIEGEGNTEEQILNAIFLCLGRMCDVIAALIYHMDLDYDTYKQEVEMYPSLMKLILKYCEVHNANNVFVDMNKYDEKIQGEYPYKLLWKADDNDTKVFILPKERHLINEKELHTASDRIVLDIENKLRFSYGASPTLEEPNSIFYMLMEFNKPKVMLPDAIWAMDKLICHAVDYIPNICEPNQDARAYASTIFSILSYDVRILISREGE